MGDRGQRRRWEYWWVALRFSLLLCFGEKVSAQIRYSIPEEVKEGSVVGNVAKDLGLDVSTLAERRFRIVSGSKDALFQVNQNNGVLYVHKNMDREELCGGNGACLMDLKIVVENPLEIHYIGVEITDVNDHSPSFAEKDVHLQIAENTLMGARFELQTARDLDIESNAVRVYRLSQNDHFDLEVKDNGEEDKLLFLVLSKPLDREQNRTHELLLTAVDGGNPPKSGLLNITVIVLDTNDNRPVFNQDIYSVSLKENSPIGTIVTTVNASDADAGLNGAIEYSLGRAVKRKVYDIFQLDSITGEIKVKGEVDFEENEVYRLNVQASDKGQPPLTVDCRVIIKVVDVNDNKPEIDVTSLSNTIAEDSKPGTVISLVSVTDKDSGINGNVISTITDNVPFELKPSFKDNVFSIVTKGRLDRELVSHYDITITATDCGQPPLSTFKTLSVQISDVNDNSPEFSQNPLELYLVENNAPGASIFSVSACDKDLNENAAISYHIVRGEGTQNDMASFLNINSDNGHISALKIFDFETLKAFQFQVVATDSGTPSLSTNVTVNVFILDQNDNAPVILYPVSTNGSAEGVEEIPRNVNAGHLVTKVRAYDADIGYNGWLLFSLQEVTDHSLFALDRYTGQIRTLRSFTETDEAEHKLVILVKDNGNVSLSATSTVIIKVVEPKEAFAASDVKSSVKDEEENSVTFYLIITLGSVSTLFLISIIVLIVMQCSKATDYSSKYLQDVNYDGTLCHSIQYRSGDKRYMLVGPRMSIGSTIVPGSNGNTLVIPEHRRASGEIF
ncbi:protocadherin alpha-3-like [Oncorhynchus mykiss]|uniref:protocadherin alpha-3-like n=1 Tax=Oncorhynchus mykiss TaxID=8022 RepID=UPI0018789E02|nr:protocadherin alpha-3-like [Oncorhynchus mykiss]